MEFGDHPSAWAPTAKGRPSASEPAAAVEATPEPEPEPEPVAEVAEETEPEETAPVQALKVAIRLTNGELITAGQADDSDKAEALAQAVVADLATQGDSWPRFEGRYLRPETIVSVDIVDG